MEAGKSLKVLLRVAVLLIIALFIRYYAENRVKENNLLEASVKHGTVVPVQKRSRRSYPADITPLGRIIYICRGSAGNFEKEKGKTNRIEPSSYGYEWWVYIGDEKIMAGVTEGSIVNQLYSSELIADVTPFEIGQDIGGIYPFTNEEK